MAQARIYFSLAISLLTISSALASNASKELVFGVLHGNGVITDILYYNNGSWDKIISRKALSFESWNNISTKTSSKPAHTTGMRKGGDTGDCNGVDWVIQTDAVDSARKVENSLAWVSNRTDGYSWRHFENVAFVHLSNNDARQDRAKEVPIALLPFAKHIKKRWFELELSILSAAISPVNHSQLRSEVNSSQYLHFSIERAIWSKNNIVLLQFNAMKIFHSPLVPERLLYDGANLFIDYDGWAAVYPDGKVAWLSESVNLMPSGENAVQDYTRIAPLALLELDDRLFLVTQSDINMGKGVTLNKEVFEFVNGKLLSRRKYLGSC